MNDQGESSESLDRIPCGDGCCIGTINEKGVCNICGKPIAGGRHQDQKQPLSPRPSQELKKTRKNRINDLVLKIGDIAGPIFLLLCCLAIIVGSFYHFDDREEIVWNKMGGASLKVVECYYPLGSIFNKDDISFHSSGLLINTRSLLGEDTKTVPYSKIKEIEIVEGVYWKSFTAKREGFWRSSDTIYFKEDQTKNTIKDLIGIAAPEMVIIERRSMLSRLAGYLDNSNRRQDPLGIRK